MSSEVRVYMRGWRAWPATAWCVQNGVLRTYGLCEPPGPFVYEAALFIVLVIVALCLWVGDPAFTIGRWIALAFQLDGNTAPGWMATGIVVGAIPVYLYFWYPLMLRLFGERFDVRVSEEEVTVSRNGRLLGAVPRIPEPEIVVDEHPRSKAAARAAQGQEGWNRLYRHSFEVAMWSDEHRIVVAALTEHEEERATALMRRLSATISNFAAVVEAAGGMSGNCQTKAKKGRGPGAIQPTMPVGERYDE